MKFIYRILNRLESAYLAGVFLLGVCFGLKGINGLGNIWIGGDFLFLLTIGFLKVPIWFKNLKFPWDLTSYYLYAVVAFFGFLISSHNWPNLDIVIAILSWLSGLFLFSEINRIEDGRKKTTAEVLGERKSLLLSALFFLMTANTILMHDYLSSIGVFSLIYPVLPMMVYYHKLSLGKAIKLIKVTNLFLGFLLFLISIN